MGINFASGVPDKNNEYTAKNLARDTKALKPEVVDTLMEAKIFDRYDSSGNRGEDGIRETSLMDRLSDWLSELFGMKVATYASKDGDAKTAKDKIVVPEEGVK